MATKFLDTGGLNKLLQLLKDKFTSVQTKITDLNDIVIGDGTKENPEIIDLIDEKDKINIAPKISLYQEDEIPLQAAYSISHMNINMRGAPVVTKDNVGREVLYFLGSGGGPNWSENKLHKAYREGKKADWVYYNSDMNVKGISGKLTGIYGCDNTYLILRTDTPKYYIARTNYSSDENEWTVYDITNWIITKSGTKYFIYNTTKEFNQILHMRYFEDYSTLVVVYQTSISMKVTNVYVPETDPPEVEYKKIEDWYYVQVLQFNNTGTPFSSVNILNSKICKGANAIPVADGYKKIEDEDVDCAWPSSEGGACTSNVLLFEEPVKDIESGELLYKKSYMSIIIPNLRFRVLQGANENRVTKYINGPKPMTFYLGEDIFSKEESNENDDPNATGTILYPSLYYQEKDVIYPSLHPDDRLYIDEDAVITEDQIIYNEETQQEETITVTIDNYMQDIKKTIYPHNSDEDALKYKISYMANTVNNSSYNTDGDHIVYYRIVMNNSKGFCILTTDDNDSEITGTIYKDKNGSSNIETYYKGIRYTSANPALNTYEYTPDASLWGKRFYLGAVMWDKIFINCRNKFGEHFFYCNAKDWQFLDKTKYNHSKKYIEPRAKTYKDDTVYYEISKDNFSTIINKTYINSDDYQFGVRRILSYKNVTKTVDGVTKTEQVPDKVAYDVSIYTYPVNMDIQYYYRKKVNGVWGDYVFENTNIAHHSTNPKRFNVDTHSGLTGIISSPSEVLTVDEETTKDVHTCNSSDNDVIKIVDYTGFVLETGSRVLVKFTNDNTASNPKLNVNDTGAKSIMYNNAIIEANVLVKNSIYEFVYDGTNYNLEPQFRGDPQYYKAMYDPIPVKFTDTSGVVHSYTGTIKYVEFTYTGTETDFKVEASSIQSILVNVNASDFNTGDSDNTFIYPGFVAYNPLINTFFMFGILDYTSDSNKSHEKRPHLIGIKPRTVTITIEEGGEEVEKTYTVGDIISYDDQDKYRINYGGANGDGETYNPSTAETLPDYFNYTNGYYTPLLPYGCTVINRNTMVIWYSCYNYNYENYIYIIYESNNEFKTSNSLVNNSTICRSRTPQSGIVYLGKNIGSTFIPVFYSGNLLRFSGQGESQNGTDYGIDTYKINIRTQKPIPCKNADSTDIEKNPSNNIISIENMLNNLSGSVVGSPNKNFYTYTMYNQSAGGLVAYLSEIPIFLGGYYTEIKASAMVGGKLEVDLEDNLYEGAPGSSLDSYGDGNYIYLERYDRDHLLLTSDKKKIIPDGAPSYNKICIAKIQTKDGKVVDGGQKNYKINTGYNAYKFSGSNYAICDTEAGELEKEVECENFILTVGARILVNFTNTSSVAGTQLNINGTGARPILYQGSTLPAGNPIAGTIYDLVYDGSSYQIIGNVYIDNQNNG